MTTKTRFYIGLNNNTMEKQTVKPEDVIHEIKQVVKGGTFLEAKGLWHGETENTLIFECIDFEEHSDIGAEELAEELEKMFNQDVVMVERMQTEVL